MANIAIFLADGFEEIEALTVVDLCRRASLNIDMVSVMGNLSVTGSHGIEVKADKLLEDVNFDEMDMLVLPGGMPGTTNLEKTEKLEQLRALWMGAKIAVIRTDDEGVGVDTPEDAVRIEEILRTR